MLINKINTVLSTQITNMFKLLCLLIWEPLFPTKFVKSVKSVSCKIICETHPRDTEPSTRFTKEN